jgi:hypothetical protein
VALTVWSDVATKVAIEYVAVNVLPEPETVAATGEPPSTVIVKAPVGAGFVEVFVTVAVNMTKPPKNEGFFEEITVVVVGAGVMASVPVLS